MFIDKKYLHIEIEVRLIFRGPYVANADARWDMDPHRSPRDHGTPREHGHMRYQEYPARTVNHWKRDEPRRPNVRTYKDVPDYWKWKHERY
jgi:hypothetical protein